MAVDVYSENIIGMNSPRFSFSKDVQENNNPYRLDHSLADLPFDFAFNVDSTSSFQSSTADELFSDGKILPTCVKNDAIVTKVKQDAIAVQCLDPDQSKTTIKKSLKEFLEDSSEEEEEEETSNNAVVPKPFWMFRRSNSLNCDRNQKKGLIGSWKILSRSGSTGKFLEKILEEDEEKPVKNPRFFWKFSRNTSLNSDQNANNNVGNNKGGNTSINVLRRSSSTNEYCTGKSVPKPIRRSNSTGSATNHVGNKKLKQQEMSKSSSQKVKVKNGNKGYDFGSYYSNSGKISPVLNLPSPYISRVSVDLFGMGSLFCNSSTKDRQKKK